jgi:hypothetical protein
VTRAQKIAELLETALQNTEGEMGEGALVDHWVPSENDPADNRLAVSRLEELFRGTGFSDADAGQIQAALSRHEIPHDAAAHLAERLRDFIGPLVERMLADPDARVRANGARAAAMALPRERWSPLDAGAVPPLIEALRDTACVRAAAMSLGHVGDLRALPALIDAWSEPRNRLHARFIEKGLTDIATREAHAAPPPVPADLPDRVRALLDAWQPADWVGRACKERGGLPLGGNQIYIWALRPDGEILCIDHESFSHATEPETDPLTRFAMMVQGARRHPELSDAIPRPPVNARPCAPCSGTGARPGQESGCMSCGARGWTAG